MYIRRKDMMCSMYKIGICDDGINICSYMEDVILGYARKVNISVDVETWNTGENLKKYLEMGNNLDILFLDIELFEITGIEVGDYIRNHLENRSMQIIYISGKASYAHRLFKTQPMDFLVKPIGQEQIESALELAIKLSAQKTAKFEFQIGKEYYYLAYDKIMYFASTGRIVKIVTPDKEWEFYGKLKEIQKRLPKEFLSIHKSFIINTEYVWRYTYEMVQLTDETKLAISRAHRKQVREQLLQDG